MKRKSELVVELSLYALALAGLLAGVVSEPDLPPPFAPGPPPAGGLRLVTWNVGAGLDGGGLKEEHLEHVARTLATLDPDLVFLQEVRGRRQAERLREALGPRWTFEASSDVVALGRGVRLSPFPIPSAFRFRAIGLTVRREGSPPVAAAGLHAQAFSAEKRNAALGATASLLAARPERYRILAGDLNLDLDLDKRRDLFTDDEYLDVETYNFVSERFRDAARGSGPTAEPDRRLDYAFVSPSFEILAAGPWKGQRAPGMDHDPVVCDLAF